MQIRCPVCDFTREVNLEKVPPTAEFATCPKCRHRFRFRALDLDEITQDAAPPEPDPKHVDVWDAVDSLRDRWQEEARSQEGNGAGNEDEFASNQTHAAIPWESPQHLGYGQSFTRTAFWAFFQPSSFFSTLSIRPALLPALLFYIIFGFIQHFLSVIWAYAASSMMREWIVEAVGEGAFTKLLEGSLAAAFDPATLAFVPFVLTIQLFFTAAILNVLIRVMEGPSANFALTFKVVAYSAVGFAATAIPLAGVFLGPVWHLALLLVGCRSAFRMNWTRTLLAMSPLLILSILGAVMQYSQVSGLLDQTLR